MEWYSVTSQRKVECVNCWMEIYASANSRKGGALCSSVTRVLGADLEGMWNTKWFYTKVSPHRLGISPLIFWAKYHLFSPGQTRVSGNTLRNPKIENTKLEVGAMVKEYSKIDMYSSNFTCVISSVFFQRFLLVLPTIRGTLHDIKASTILSWGQFHTTFSLPSLAPGEIEIARKIHFFCTN